MLVTQRTRAGAIDTLLITENSSTSLTAILNGTTSLNVVNTGTDHWTINGLTGITGAGLWMEPGPAGFGNLVFASATSPGNLFVISDNQQVGGIPDNIPDSTSFTLGGAALSVTFHDLGDAATVPDTGTTFSLLGFSLTGLAFLSRKLSGHLPS
jgi:hypothetical protein